MSMITFRKVRSVHLFFDEFTDLTFYQFFPDYRNIESQLLKLSKNYVDWSFILQFLHFRFFRKSFFKRELKPKVHEPQETLFTTYIPCLKNTYNFHFHFTCSCGIYVKGWTCNQEQKLESTATSTEKFFEIVNKSSDNLLKIQKKPS